MAALTVHEKFNVPHTFQALKTILLMIPCVTTCVSFCSEGKSTIQPSEFDLIVLPIASFVGNAEYNQVTEVYQKLFTTKAS